MKKIILVIAAVALLASPAMAVDWNFYGSARMATFYQSRDYNNGTFADLDAGGLADGAAEDEDARIQWQLQGNSRLGATVRAENIRGRFEFGINDTPSGGGTVTSRRIFGTWDFGAATLKVGKDYTPFKQFISGQVFAGDAGLLGNGAAYGGRRGQLSLAFGGFEVALIENGGGALRNQGTGDVDKYMPKVEASWGMSFDTWNFNLIGGFQYYEVENSGVGTEDVDVVSWALGGDVGVNFGPAYIKAGGSYGQNIGNAGWAGGAGGVNTASYDGDDDTDDVDTWQAALIGGFKFTDQLTLEAGFGYLNNDSDAPGEDESDESVVYVQGVISLAPGVWVIPEIGWQNFGDEFGGTGNDAGEQIYAGAKWQIDF